MVRNSAFLNLYVKTNNEINHALSKHALINDLQKWKDTDPCVGQKE